MEKMYSGVTSLPQSSINQIRGLKAEQDAQTARLGSDTVAKFGTSDPDQAEFLTKPFQRLKIMQTETTGTLAFMPDQNPKLDTPYYANGTPFILDKAGNGAFSTNIARTGDAPAGYTSNDKLMVQKRVKNYFDGEEEVGNPKYKWAITVRGDATDYAMKENERLDGDFFPGSIHRGMARPYGHSFPTAGGVTRRLYNGDPFTSDGWTGSPHTVVDNPLTKPQIDSISPTTMVKADGPILVDIYGHHFTGAGFVLLGPFMPGMILTSLPPDPDMPGIYYDEYNPPGGYYYRAIDGDTHLQIASPPDIEVGVWDLIVIGNDGQVGVLEKCFTVTES